MKNEDGDDMDEDEAKWHKGGDKVRCRGERNIIPPPYKLALGRITDWLKPEPKPVVIP